MHECVDMYVYSQTCMNVFMQYVCMYMCMYICRQIRMSVCLNESSMSLHVCMYVYN